MSFTQATDQMFLAIIANSTTFTASSPIYLALSTTTPTYAGTNFTEPSSNGYARVAIATSPHTASFSLPSGSPVSTSNTVVFTFPQATGSWGTITYFGLFDFTGTILLGYGAMTTPQTISAGQTLTFPVGSITLSIN
jgi:hypothetical protein